MKNNIRNKTALLAAAALASAVVVPVVHAAANPFSNMELASGFNLAHDKDTTAGGEDKSAEGKCAEGKCAEMKDDGKADAGKDKEKDKDEAEGKCGEGKCGEAMDDAGAEKSPKK